MKIAYFDCFSGISGDMILGALIDAGLNPEELKNELEKLNVSGFELTTEKVKRNSISGTKVNVGITEEHVHRHLHNIIEIIEKSSLDEDIKKTSEEIFRKLAEVEAKIHDTSVEKIHFHEVGALDSIVDIIGSVIGLKKLGIEKIYSSEIHLGSGFVNTQHGKIPVPVPATSELLKGIPVYSTGIESELVTPTGAVIISTLSSGFGELHRMKINSIGYGAGSKILKIPNLLRIFIGEILDDNYEKDEVMLVETNIDDMNPEFFDYVSEKLLTEGALDVYKTPIFMKKNRPAILLSVIISEEKLNRILSIIFSETTTLGVRIQRINRQKLTREIITLNTRYGKVDIKVSKHGNEIKNLSPEYENCRQIAAKHNVPVKEVFEEAKAAAREKLL